MRKKGFTLIEIMVVVVIMGLLSAVAVPKLFGLIAKAKASEVPVAAGTYISLQNAFISEKIGLGSWKDIGYNPPGDGATQNFEYGPGCIDAPVLAEDFTSPAVGWQASNLSKLNDCAINSTWAISMTHSSVEKINYNYQVSSDECAVLTSNWNVSKINVTSCPPTIKSKENTNPTSPNPEPDNPSSEPEPDDNSDLENDENDYGLDD